MKMSDENARRLSRILLWNRIRQIVTVVALFAMIVIPMAGIMAYRISRTDATIAERDVDGTVITARPTGRGNIYRVSVHLADGREVEAVSTLRLAIVKGAHVLVNDTEHASGVHSYAIAKIIR